MKMSKKEFIIHLLKTRDIQKVLAMFAIMIISIIVFSIFTFHRAAALAALISAGV